MMDLKFVNTKWCLKLFIILKLFIHESNSQNVTLDNLRTICCIDSGTKEVTNITPALQYCTAISKFGANDNTTDNDITILRGNLTYVYIYDQKKHRKIKKKIKSKRVDDFVKQIEDLINTDKIDVMLFDHFAPEHKYQKKNKESFQDNLVGFLSKLKGIFPGKLFGVYLPKDEKYLKEGFNVSAIDSAVDVYLLKSTGYKNCKKRFPLYNIVNPTKQKDMNTVDPSNNLDDSLKLLRSKGYNLSKVLLDVRVVANTVNYWHSDTKNDLSYANYCKTDHKKKSKFCLESLNDFYTKGYLVNKYHMAGVFIQSIDRDDYLCTCNCGYYPVVQCLYAGSKGLGPPPLVNCLFWALTPGDRGNMPQTDDSGLDNDGTESDNGPAPNVNPAAEQPGGDPNDDSE